MCGLLVLMKNDLDRSVPEDSLGTNDSLVYFKLEQTPSWAQQHPHESQKLFTRCASEGGVGGYKGNVDYN